MAEKTTQLAAIDRFTNAVLSCYGDAGNGIEVSQKEIDILKGYFLQIDLALKSSKDGLTWNMVNLTSLAPRLKHYARLGLDMQLPNHLFAVPFKSSTSKYITLNLIPGYEGRKYIAKKFAVTPFKDIIAHLVGENDTFEPIYRDATHTHDDYIFKESPFNKGKIIGAFGYVLYDDSEMNRLTVMSIEEIKKHKPAKASEKFWEGDWKNKMYLKTVIIEACKNIALDAEKIREYQEDLEQIEAYEIESTKAIADAEAEQKMSSGDMIDIDYSEFDETPAENP